ncbi:MAG: HAMP domain-containing protein [Curvibacter sp.]|nr:HAMP domain-containing protein [Curvibacter sp.]
MFDTAFMPAQQAYNAHIQAFEKLESTLLQQKIEAQRQQAQRRSLLVMGGAVGLGALILLLAVGITSHIRRSLTRAVAVARAVADGDLSERPQVEGRDEFAGLMQSLSDMSDSLQAIVASVREGTDNIAMASAEIAHGNQDLSARTESQASAIEQTSASMEQLSATVRHNADHATQATELALDASQVAVRGGDVVASVVSTMGGISEASKKISDIIGVIDGIAFQTNILALNAAVEAARAGEQGRGFAVVAGEVRSLAGRSAQAAREIKSLISDSAERVERGSTLVAQAGDTMADVVSRIHKVAELMKDVRQASSQQSAGVAQVGEAVHQMDQSTQQNAALVEQVSAAASSLESQSRRLVEAVSVFQIQPGGAGRPLRQDTRPRSLVAGPAHKALPG